MLMQCLAFVLALGLAYSGIVVGYSQPDTFEAMGINSVAAMPENTIDGIIVGPSVVSCGWVSAVGWENYGITTYHLGTGVQPFGSVPGYVDFLRKNHDLKYVVVDVHSLRKENIRVSVGSGAMVETFWNMSYIDSRFNMLGYLFDYADRVYDYYGGTMKDKLNKLNPYIYTSLLDIHNRWVDGLSDEHRAVAIMDEYLGAPLSYSAFSIVDMTPYLPNLDFEGYIEIDDFQKNELELLFDYLEKENLEVLFISAPSFRDSEIQQELSSILKYCSDRGYNTIDFSTRETLDEAGIDVKTDFCDRGHLNLSGGEKMTDYVCKFLVENGYSCEDHRGQSGYEAWEEGTKSYMELSKKGWERTSKKDEG